MQRENKEVTTRPNSSKYTFGTKAGSKSPTTQTRDYMTRWFPTNCMPMLGYIYGNGLGVGQSANMGDFNP